MSHHLTQGPSRPTRNSQQAGIAERILDFGRHRSPLPAEIPTVVQTPASLVPWPFNRLWREIPAYAKPVPLGRRPGFLYHDSWANVPNTGPRNPWITNWIGWWTYYRVFGYRRLHALPIPNPVDGHAPRHDWPSGRAFRPSSASHTTRTRRTQYFTLPPVSGGNFL